MWHEETKQHSLPILHCVCSLCSCQLLSSCRESWPPVVCSDTQWWVSHACGLQQRPPSLWDSHPDQPIGVIQALLASTPACLYCQRCLSYRHTSVWNFSSIFLTAWQDQGVNISKVSPKIKLSRFWYQVKSFQVPVFEIFLDNWVLFCLYLRGLCPPFVPQHNQLSTCLRIMWENKWTAFKCVDCEFLSVRKLATLLLTSPVS